MYLQLYLGLEDMAIWKYNAEICHYAFQSGVKHQSINTLQSQTPMM